MSSSVVSITSRETEKALRFRQAVLLDDVIMMATHHVIRRSFTTHRAPGLVQTTLMVTSEGRALRIILRQWNSIENGGKSYR